MRAGKHRISVVGWTMRQAEDLSHDQARQRLAAQYEAIPPGEPVRLAKRTSNLFRPRTELSNPGLDVSGLNSVLSVDAETRTADVQGMTTYEDLVDATLAHGLMPYVVPQLKTITLGGAVTGLGIESSSFRNGLPHESVREIEILTGDGQIVIARPDNEYADLFHSFPNSYGTLGYALRLVIDLEPVQPFVHLRHVRFHDLEQLVASIDKITTDRTYDGEDVDFLDGTVFSADEAYLTLGAWAKSAPYSSDYTGSEIYYRSVQKRARDYLTVHDYLWRWDTDWFWCSRAFGAQNRYIRRLWPKRWLRSDIYWKIIRFENKRGVAARINRMRGLPDEERVVQDVEIPLARTADFLRWFLKEIPIEPIWLCPLQLRDTKTSRRGWPLYPLAVDERYVNVGFWSSVPISRGGADGDANKRIESEVAGLGGHKSLYSDAYYSKADFWSAYGGNAYAAIKERFDPARRLPDLYEKVVNRK